MNQVTAHKKQYTKNQGHLYCAFELGKKNWKLAFTVGFGQKPRQRSIVAGDLPSIREEIDSSKNHFGLSEDARVLSCYEAGRDGFWLHRYLIQFGVRDLVVDSSSNRGEPEGEAI